MRRVSQGQHLFERTLPTNTVHVPLQFRQRCRNGAKRLFGPAGDLARLPKGGRQLAANPKRELWAILSSPQMKRLT